MNFRMCVDVGGTFTDLVCVDEQGEVRIFKSSTTPADLTEGVFNGLELASQHYGLPLSQFEGSFRYAGTVATNAIIQGTAAKTGLICTRGHRDILTYREGGGREEIFNWDRDYPEPYVPRYLTLPVTERINAEGGVEVPLAEDEVRQVVRQLKVWNVQAIAVCLLWSIVNPAHEKRIGEIVAEEWPGIPCVLSHELNPIIREYRRASSTAIDASLRPLVSRQLADLAARFASAGFRGALSVVTSGGGAMTVEEIGRRPIYTVGSGPAMAPVAGRLFGRLEKGKEDVLTVDMGGTSFDVSLVTRGNIAVSREGTLAGHMLGISAVDVESIGAGGGSIAWVDPGGLIHVGPQSAGAVPGPACYLRGGTEPTVSDANVVAGYLDPDYFLGGRMKIDAKLAQEVIREKIAKPLGLSVPEAAFTILTTVNHNMIAAIQNITVWQGIDPREYLMVAGGGAAGLHVVPIARELGMREILVPKVAGALSAAGGVVADVSSDFSASFFAVSSEFDYDGVNRVLADLEARANAFLKRVGVAPRDRVIQFFVEARYPAQVWEIEVPLRAGRIADAAALQQLVEDFHETHERIFAIKEPGQRVECVYWRARGIGKVPAIPVREQQRSGEDATAALMGKRPAYFRELGGFVVTPVFNGDRLAYGNRIVGPAILEEPTTTVVLFPGSEARVTKFGNYAINLTP